MAAAGQRGTVFGTGESRQFLVGLQKAGAVVAAEKVLVSRHQAANHNRRCHQQAHAKDEHAQQHNQDHQGPKTQHAEKLRIHALAPRFERWHWAITAGNHQGQVEHRRDAHIDHHQQTSQQRQGAEFEAFVANSVAQIEQISREIGIIQ